jgi:hypothetical protein
MYYIFEKSAIYKQTRIFNTTLTFRGNISRTPLRKIYLNARIKDFLPVCYVVLKNKPVSKIRKKHGVFSALVLFEIRQIVFSCS